MKRILLPTLAGVFVATASVAQQAYTDLNLKAFDASTESVESIADRPNETTQLANRAEGDTIWYDSFADLSNWMVGTTGALGTADSVWEHTLTGPYGTFSGSWGDVQGTQSDGWAMFDSDGNGSADPQTGAPTGVEFDTYLQLANPQDFTNQPVVAVTFTEFYKALQSETYIDVSTDGTNWTSILVHTGFSANDQTAQDEILYQDISPLAGGQPQVWIRLRFVGFGYFWQVDDFLFVEGVENDLAITRLFTGDNENDYLYTRKPLTQMTEIELGVVVENQGGLDQTNVNVDWEISDGSSVVASGTQAITTSLVAGDMDTVFFSTGYTPSATGIYTFDMDAYSDQTDSDLSDNVASDSYEVTEFVWAHDYEAEPYQAYGYDADEQQGADGFEMGADYFCQVDGDFIYGATFALGNSTTAASVTVKIYEDDPANGPVSETIYDIPSGMLSTGSNMKFITVVLDDPVEMLAGSVYTATVAIESGDDGYIMGNPVDDDDRGQSVYFAFEDTWYYWSGLTTSMRLNINPDVAGIESDVAKFGFGLYPNPATDNVEVRVDADANIDQLTIVDISGKLVKTVAVANRAEVFRMDLSELNAGVYFVNAISADGITSQKLILN